MTPAVKVFEGQGLHYPPHDMQVAVQCRRAGDG
jgi:hypothetical protein